MWRKREEELRKEMEAHLAEEAEERSADGLSEAEARDAARKAFGNTLQAHENARQAWGWIALERVLQDVSYALRGMRRSPVLTLVGIGTLALGIGANTAIFSVVSAVLLRPLGYQDPERLVHISHARFSPMAPANFLDLQQQADSFATMAAVSAWSGNLTTKSGPQKILGLMLSEGTFSMLGVAPLHGRTFLGEEHQPGKERVAVLSHRLWQREFAANPAAIGSTLPMSGETYTIVGVMPPSFQFTPYWMTEAEIWIPLTLADKTANRRAQFLRTYARLKPAVSMEQAATELASLWRGLENAYPLENGKFGIRLRTLNEMVVGDIRPALLVLLVSVGFVLLIACANLANLSLARSVERRREIAIRTALGAGRGRIIRQLVTESLVMALSGGALGALLALYGVDALKAWMQAEAVRFASTIPRVDSIAVDGQVLLFTAAVSIVTGLLFGLFPALEATRQSLNGSLREGARGSSEGPASLRARNVLVVAEVALSIVLLAGAGLMLRSFAALRAVDPGFEPKQVVTMQVSVAGQAQMKGERRVQFFHQVVDKVRALPGVESAAMVNHIPIGGDNWRFRAFGEGLPLPAQGEEIAALYRVTTPGYFGAMRIPLLAGRDFSLADHAGAAPVVILNETLARRLWPGESAVGKRISTGQPNGAPQWTTVVGVVRDAKQESLMQPSDFEYFFPYAQSPMLRDRMDPGFAYMTLVVRSSLSGSSLTGAIRAVLAGTNGEAVLSEVRSLEQVISSATWQSRFYMLALLVFAGFALLLAAVGIYGVMAWSVSRRSQEIGIRIALGANRGNVVWMVLRQSVLVVSLGVAIGLPLAFAGTRAMGKMLYGVTPSDPATFVAVPLVLLGVALAASYLPARRASGLDPVTALRAG